MTNYIEIPYLNGSPPLNPEASRSFIIARCTRTQVFAYGPVNHVLMTRSGIHDDSSVKLDSHVKRTGEEGAGFTAQSIDQKLVTTDSITAKRS
jgi:hypothetical protein